MPPRVVAFGLSSFRIPLFQLRHQTQIRSPKNNLLSTNRELFAGRLASSPRFQLELRSLFGSLNHSWVVKVFYSGGKFDWIVSQQIVGNSDLPTKLELYSSSWLDSYSGFFILLLLLVRSDGQFTSSIRQEGTGYRTENTQAETLCQNLRILRKRTKRKWTDNFWRRRNRSLKP